ncbi:MAG: DUF3592 domain-containing protein [Gemmatimonadaceae bacterium]|nr:DUF3592 domain-containing protein [Gemmatimonadaceae bacterium]
MTERQAAEWLMGFGATCLLWTGLPFRVALSTRWWPRTSGRVRERRVLSLPASPTVPRAQDLEPAVRVAYEVNGKMYETTTVRWTGISLLQTTRTLERYPVGTTVTVYYDRDAPQRAVLEPGPTFESIAQVVVSVLLIAAGAAWYLTA